VFGFWYKIHTHTRKRKKKCLVHKFPQFFIRYEIIRYTHVVCTHVVTNEKRVLAKTMIGECVGRLHDVVVVVVVVVVVDYVMSVVFVVNKK